MTWSTDLLDQLIRDTEHRTPTTGREWINERGCTVWLPVRAMRDTTGRLRAPWFA